MSGTTSYTLTPDEMRTLKMLRPMSMTAPTVAIRLQCSTGRARRILRRLETMGLVEVRETQWAHWWWLSWRGEKIA